MKSSVKKMIEDCRKYNRELDEAGGPSADGRLFEKIIGLQEDILAAFGLPPADKYLSLLWDDQDIDDVVRALELSAQEYRERPIKDPALLLAHAALTGNDDPGDLLTRAGFSVHVYQLFLFRERLLGSLCFEEIDAVLGEMRKAETRLNDLGILGIGGIRKNRDLYWELREAGMTNLDLYLMEQGAFDLDDGDMEPEQFFFRGLWHAKHGRLPRAVADFTTAAGSLTDAAEVYYNRGLALELLGRIDEAVKDYTEALGRNPEKYDALCNRGALYASAGMPDEALRDFDRAVEIGPRSFPAYCARGNLLASLGERETLGRALEDYSRAIWINPGVPDLYFNRGMTLRRLGREGEAREDLKKAAGMGHEPAQEMLLLLSGAPKPLAPGAGEEAPAPASRMPGSACPTAGDSARQVEKRRKASPENFGISPLSRKRRRIEVEARFTPEEYERMKYGFMPEDSDDKWFIYEKRDVFFFHRSMTGYCIFKAGFRRDGDCVVPSEVWVSSRDIELDDGEARRMFLELIYFRLLGREVSFDRESNVILS